MILSDGWDRGDPEQLGTEMARLGRSAHRLVWLNPLAAHPDYEPLTRGMRAAVPHTDELLAGQLARLARAAGGDLGGDVNDILDDITRWTERGDRVATATVVGVKRSAPRPPGAKMAINERGEVSGAVSGGCVEGAVVEIAEQVLGGGEPQLLHFGIADDEAWDVGLPCGGEIDVWVQAYEPGAVRRDRRGRRTRAPR